MKKQKAKTKPRKPKAMQDMWIHEHTVYVNFHYVIPIRFNLYYAKRLHKFLGQAIAYLEHKEAK